MKLKHIFLSAVAICASSAMADGISYADWMAQLPDSTKVRSLSIPGTHDSASKGTGITLFGATTQAYSISDQWDKGVRAFDLRPRKDMAIYHGAASCNINMKDVFETITKKIADTKEFAIFVVRYEEDGDIRKDRDAFASNLKSVIDTYKDYIVEFSPSLKVKNVRGKIIMLVRGDFDSELAASLSDFNSSDNLDDQRNHSARLGRTRTKVYVQDHFEYSNNDEKQNAIKNLIDEASANTYYPMWVINHTSGYQGDSSSDSNVKNNAKTMNAYLVDYLTNASVATRAAEDGVNGKTGIVMMDYAGDDTYSGQKLIDALINQNAKYLALGEDEDLTVGVNEVESDFDAEGVVEIYSVNGMKVGESLQNLEPGIYILRQGEKSSKIVVK